MVRLMLLAGGALALLAATPVPGRAQAPADEADGSIAERFERIDQMLDAVDMIPEWDRDGMLFRVDEEILAIQDEIAAVAGRLPSRGVGSASEASGVDDGLRDWLDRTLALSLERIGDLDRRIDVELETYDEFSNSADTIISRAFVQDLRRVRLRHLLATIDQLDRRDTLGLSGTAEIRARLESGLELEAQRLVGQLRLDAMTLEELRKRIAADPADETLRSALRAVERKHSGNLDTVGGLITVLSRLDKNTTELRALQAQQRGLIGAEILDSDVFMSLVDDRVEMARERLILAGPAWLLRLLAFITVLLLAWLVARGARELVRRITSHRSVELGDLRERTLVSLTYSVVLLVGVVVALSALGVSLVPLLAGLGVASIIVGLALQESLGNLAAGGMILATRPFDLHDQIRVGTAEGKVKDMSLVATTIASHDNKMLVIPNRQVWSSTITNFTRAKVRRVDIEVSIPAGADLARVERLLRECIDREERVLQKPAPLIHFGEMDDSAVSFWVRAWVETPDVDGTEIALKRTIAESLRQSGIDSGVQTR